MIWVNEIDVGDAYFRGKFYDVNEWREFKIRRRGKIGATPFVQFSWGLELKTAVEVGLCGPGHVEKCVVLQCTIYWIVQNGYV